MKKLLLAIFLTSLSAFGAEPIKVKAEVALQIRQLQMSINQDVNSYQVCAQQMPVIIERNKVESEKLQKLVAEAAKLSGVTNPEGYIVDPNSLNDPKRDLVFIQKAVEVKK